VAVEDPVSSQPRYGVIWFTARTEVDKEARIVALEDVTVSKADFPTTPDGGAAYLAALRQILSGQPLTIALDRLQAELEVERVEDPGRIVQVKNDPPRIIVSQGPALLVRIDGQPVLREVVWADILQVTNTDDDLFLYTPQQDYYVLLSGRWFRAKSLEGPWEYVATGLPGDFARIPESHPKGAVLASVPGTPQARQAVIANDIPQTATISRNGAKLAVHYDGQPQLKPIEGTPLQYVVNASFPVIRVDAT